MILPTSYDAAAANNTELTSTARMTAPVTCLIVLVYILIAVAILMHMIGIVLILTKSSEMTNQSRLLLHLSVVSIALLCLNVYAVYGFTVRKTNATFKIAFYVIYIAYIVNLLLLTVDRLALAFMVLRYSQVMSRGLCYVQLAVLWILALTYGLAVRYVKSLNSSMALRHDVSFGYNGFVVCFTGLSYAIILVRVKTSASRVSSSHTVTRDLFKKYLIPVFLVSSFFLLNVFPALIERYIKQSRTPEITILLIGLNCLNNLFDPIIYIFLQRSIREKLNSLCHRCFHRITLYRTISENHVGPVTTESGVHHNLGADSTE